MNDISDMSLLAPADSVLPALSHAPLPPSGAAVQASATPAWLDALNPAQRAAASWGERGADGRFRAGPQLVIAGAGTGKTAMLAHR
ncbi:MAG: hypothetical protein IH616_14840, partial [Gemmatimonadales bacterium]|nr:hypothetical protein [Gemmatimonadales bacterium]